MKELSLIGQRPALPPLQWWQGAEFALTEGTVALLFFEAWDPHSPNFLPSAARLLRGLGIKVVGVHKGTKNSTDEKIRAVAATFAPDAILRDNGDLSRQFQVVGIPAIAILHHGAVLWRDHPRRLNPTALQTSASQLRLPSALPVGADACGPGAPPAQADLATAAHALAALQSMVERKGEHPQLPCEYATLSERREAWTKRLSEALRRDPPPWSDTAAMAVWLTVLPAPEEIWHSVWEAQPKGGQMAAILLSMSQSDRVEERRAAAALLIHYDDATYRTGREALVRLQEDPDLLTQRRASRSLEELDLNESTSGSEGK